MDNQASKTKTTVYNKKKTYLIKLLRKLPHCVCLVENKDVLYIFDFYKLDSWHFYLICLICTFLAICLRNDVINKLFANVIYWLYRV